MPNSPGQRTQSLIQFTKAQLVPIQFLLDRADKAALADRDGKVWG